MVCIPSNLCSVYLLLFLSYTVNAENKEAAFNASVWCLAEIDIEKGPSSKPGVSLLRCFFFYSYFSGVQQDGSSRYS